MIELSKFPNPILTIRKCEMTKTKKITKSQLSEKKNPRSHQSQNPTFFCVCVERVESLAKKSSLDISIIRVGIGGVGSQFQFIWYLFFSNFNLWPKKCVVSFFLYTLISLFLNVLRGWISNQIVKSKFFQPNFSLWSLLWLRQ